MGRNVEWSDIPDNLILDDGLYQLEIESITEGATKAGALMYTALFRVADGPHAGVPIYDRFAIGNADDPTADDPQTWVKSVGARRLKRLFKCAGLTLGPDVDAMIRAATQQHFNAMIVVEIDDGVKDPKYKGVKRNRLQSMYPMSEGHEAAVAAPKPAPAPPRPPVASVPKAPRAQSVPQVPTVTCGYCREKIARDQYINHVDTMHGGEE